MVVMVVPVVMVKVVVMMVPHRPRRLVVYRSRSAGAPVVVSCATAYSARPSETTAATTRLSIIIVPVEHPQINFLKPV